jgi:hypothetical protein
MRAALTIASALAHAAAEQKQLRFFPGKQQTTGNQQQETKNTDQHVIAND